MQIRHAEGLLHPTSQGAAGFVGSHLVQQLLEKGYTVHGTVRSLMPRDSRWTHLNQLAAALPGSLKLFRADLLEQNSFDEAVKGCRVIFHTAYVFIMLLLWNAQRFCLQDSVLVRLVSHSCDFCQHIAAPELRSPFIIDVPDPQKDLIDPALQGTRSVLASALAHKDTIQRVILTSSVAGEPLLLGP